MNTNVARRTLSDANDLTTEIAEVTEFRQNERDFRIEEMGFPQIQTFKIRKWGNLVPAFLIISSVSICVDPWPTSTRAKKPLEFFLLAR